MPEIGGRKRVCAGIEEEMVESYQSIPPCLQLFPKRVSDSDMEVKPKKHRRDYKGFGMRSKLYNFISGLDSQENEKNSRSGLRQTDGDRGVSTRLELALNDTSTDSHHVLSDQQPDMGFCFPCLEESLASELQKQNDELNRDIKLQVERMRCAIEVQKEKHLQILLMKVGKIMDQKFQEKQRAIEIIARYNLELEEKVKDLMIQVKTWQSNSKCNEQEITRLQANLHQAIVQFREQCGESEVEDATSYKWHLRNQEEYCNSNNGNDNEGGAKEKIRSSLCLVCGSGDICILFFPCKHLCLCKNCENRVDFCPLCSTPKIGSMEVYFS